VSRNASCVDEIDWCTTERRERRRHPWWKKPLHEDCPHGLKIFLVDGSHIRNHFDSDFDQGGNGWAYDFVPKTEIWIDDHVPMAELAYVAFHECHEAELMRGGMSYDRAHEATKRLEDHYRHRDHPGESRRRRS